MIAVEAPPIFARRREIPLLQRVAERAMRSVPATGQFLADEIARARAIDDHEQMINFARIGSWIMFYCDITRKTHFHRLVLPENADLANGKLSVLTQYGAALLGLRQGDSFAWRPEDGSTRRVTALMVV